MKEIYVLCVNSLISAIFGFFAGSFEGAILPFAASLEAFMDSLGANVSKIDDWESLLSAIFIPLLSAL